MRLPAITLQWIGLYSLALIIMFILAWIAIDHGENPTLILALTVLGIIILLFINLMEDELDSEGRLVIQPPHVG
jgi:hypothetical protein